MILGDLGEGFTAERLNGAFRLLMDGASLSRCSTTATGAAGQPRTGCGRLLGRPGVRDRTDAVVVGKPSPDFFAAAVADMGAERAVMVGDDVEADVGGALAAGLAGVLVRTGKYRDDALEGSGVTPTAIADSIAEVPELLGRLT